MIKAEVARSREARPPGAELIDDQQPLRERPRPGGPLAHCDVHPSMDKKNSSSAHIIDSMSVCTRMPETLIRMSFPVLRSM